ncbi:hypothetical protein C9374_005907 [Naegleria lovaniensis]|uniref:Uncharacterized protein n=1 Tax=Naegleria lovaniensis TaxID=51637 RepID=A0AA88KK00_NAELO|nr:uncharacterized protein C9374_005907 [Naegleria lovaniensis]KAG2382115.1 hypothetical protein C9374_005907 [Naegleria lovaniensis]
MSKHTVVPSSQIIASSGEQTTHQLIEFITQQNPSVSGFIKILARRDYIYAITYPDHEIYCTQLKHWINNTSSSLMFDPLEKNGNGLEIGLKRAYFVAASYDACFILVDRIVDGIVMPDLREGYATHELPNGECYEIPKRSSVVCLQIGRNTDVSTYCSELVNLSSNENPKFWLSGIENALRKDEFITYMACAANTLVLVTNHGRLIVGGSNGFGECGYGEKRSFSATSPHPFCEENPHVKFCKVACGDHNIVALTQCGRIYVCGYNSTCELGISDTGDQKEIKESVGFAKITHSDPAIDVACHYYGVIFLTKSGSVFVSGGSNKSLTQITLPYQYNGTLFNVVKSIGAGSQSFMISLTDSNHSDYLLLTVSRQSNYASPIEMHKEFFRSISPNTQRIDVTGSDHMSYISYVQQRAVIAGTTLQKQLTKHLTDCYEEKSLSDIDMIFFV